VEIEAWQLPTSSYVKSVVIDIISIRVCRVACSVVEVNSQSKIYLKIVLIDRCRVLTGADRIASDNRCFAVSSNLDPLGALAVVRIGLNLSASGVIARLALLVETVPIRIGAGDRTIADVRVMIQRLRSSRRPPKLSGDMNLPILEP